MEVLTEDHRLTGPVEKQRLQSIGKALPEGATRLCGMQISLPSWHRSPSAGLCHGHLSPALHTVLQ